MGKLIVFNLITLDGYFEGPDAEIDWHNVDAEFKDFAAEQLKTAGALLFGRKTYELMAGYWPSRHAIQNDPVVADLMNNINKYVCSSTLTDAGWTNTKLLKGSIKEETANLKKKEIKDILILGSGRLTSLLTNAGLIDEFRLIINPLLLGKGRNMFEGIDKSIKLNLERSRTFNSGNILLYYTLKKEK